MNKKQILTKEILHLLFSYQITSYEKHICNKKEILHLLEYTSVSPSQPLSSATTAEMAPGLTASGDAFGASGAAGAAGAAGAVLSATTGAAVPSGAPGAGGATIPSTPFGGGGHWQAQWGLVYWPLPPWSIGTVCPIRILVQPFLSCFCKTNMKHLIIEFRFFLLQS